MFFAELVRLQLAAHAAGQSLSFASPKASNQRKGDPDGCPDPLTCAPWPRSAHKQRNSDLHEHPHRSIVELSRLTVTQQGGSFDLYVDINYNAAVPPFQVSPSTISNECMCLGLRRAARAASRRFDEALRPLELNNGQFSMLTAIAGMQPVGIQALADHLAMDRTTVTAALKPLQRRGLVEAEVSETDARGRDARLTAAGSTLVTEAIPIWQSFQAQLNGGLAPTEVARMREFLALLS